MTLDAADVREGRVLRLRLMLGFCELSDVERWADSLIARLDDPPYELVELSLARINGTAGLSILVGDSETADDLLLAMASVDPEAYDTKTLADALERTRELAFGVGARGAWTLAVDLLGFGIDPYALLNAQRRGKLTEEQVRKQMYDHFRQLRELAAVGEATV